MLLTRSPARRAIRQALALLSAFAVSASIAVAAPLAAAASQPTLDFDKNPVPPGTITLSTSIPFNMTFAFDVVGPHGGYVVTATGGLTFGACGPDKSPTPSFGTSVVSSSGDECRIVYNSTGGMVPPQRTAGAGTSDTQKVGVQQLDIPVGTHTVTLNVLGLDDTTLTELGVWTIVRQSSGGGGSCTDATRQANYVTPQLWVPGCDENSFPGIQLTGTVGLTSTAPGRVVEYRATLPANVDEIAITTSGSMRYRATGDPMNPPPKCGAVLDVDVIPIGVDSTGTDAAGTANCVIDLSPASTSTRTVFVPGFLIVPDGGTFTVTYTLRQGNAVVGTPASFTVVKAGGTSGTVSSSASSNASSASVNFAAQQSTAAGVAGTSAAVMIRGGEVVPVSSSIASGVGPRGGVVLAAEGLTVSVASAVGARPGSGVVVPEGGALECSLCGDFAPGSVVEAWINSDPRLAAAVAIPADAEDGDCHQLAIPTDEPLDGGGPIEAGAHTLQLQMYTQDGFAVLSTGITVGSITPAGVPAGEGEPWTGGSGRLLALLLGVAGVALLARRREVVTA